MSQWGQLFGTQPPPRGTLADMANRYPSDMADQQNREIALGAITPFANAARWGGEQLSKLYDWLPDSATTQATKLRAQMDRAQGRTETNPYVYNALYPTPMPPVGPMPSQLPRTDQDFYRQLYAPRPAPPGSSSAANAGIGTGSPATPPSASNVGLASVAAGKATRVAPMNSSAPPAPTPTAPSNLAALPFPNGSAIAYPSRQDANYFRQVPTLADVVGPPNPYGGMADGLYGPTGYAVPGVSAMGGQQPGLATFQGMPRGGTLGYAGTPETQGLSQGAATDANVAAYNRQIAALRDLREAQNPGITTGQAGRTFGGLVSFGTPGGNYGDEAMQAQQAQSYLNQATKPGIYRGQRNALLQAGLALLNRQNPTATYLENAGPSNSLTPFQAQQLLQDQQRQQFEQNRWAQQWPMDQQRGLAEIAKLRQDAAPKPPSESQQKAALISQILEANQALPHAQTPEQQAKVTAYLNQLTGNDHQLFSKPDPLAALMAQQQPAQ